MLFIETGWPDQKTRRRTMTNNRRIWADKNSVFLRDENEMGEEIIRHFWVPSNGGYVREVSSDAPGVLGSQVCDRLSNRGNTLSSSADGLLDVILRQYRARQASRRREDR
jgi:hypothetical protein